MASLALLSACGDKEFTNVVLQEVGTTLTIVSGDGQTGVVGTTLAAPLVVRVLDAAGFAVPGAVVTFTVAQGNGSVSAATVTSDANGDAAVSWTLGTTIAAQAVTASLANGASVTFTATATAGPFLSLTKVSGDNQTIAVGTQTQPFVVRAVDANGNAVAGVVVSWVFTTVGQLPVTATSTTDAAGLASITFTVAHAGAFTVTATSGASTVTFNGTGV